MAETGPKVRHEFVGMMFAITVGEIGLQTAGLVQARNAIHYLPAYSHLLLATFVVAASWVGWSRSLIPGARQDVEEVFEWAFVVLLFDMAMVVTYFIVVRTVDFGNEHHRIDPAYAVARWHVVIFGLYLAWDVVTKVFMYERHDMGWWEGWEGVSDALKKKRTDRFRRMVPTVICFVLSWYLWDAFEPITTGERLLTADFALLSIVLLFRALKSLEGAIWWKAPAKSETKKLRRLTFRVACTAACLVGFLGGTWMTLTPRPLPHLGLGIVQGIREPVKE